MQSPGKEQYLCTIFLKPEQMTAVKQIKIYTNNSDMIH